MAKRTRTCLMTDALRLFLIEDDPDMALLIRKSLERAAIR